MKHYTLSLLLVVACSCNTTKNFNLSDNKDIGIEWTFSERVNESYMDAVDSMIRLSIAQYNVGSHTYKFHKRKAVDTEYVTLHFTNGKKVTPKQKKTGYILSGIGLIGIPAAMVAANIGFAVGFYYYPLNSLDAKVSLSPAMTDSIYRYKKLRVQTGVLFKPDALQVQKLYTKFQLAFSKLLIRMNDSFEEKKKRGM